MAHRPALFICPRNASPKALCLLVVLWLFAHYGPAHADSPNQLPTGGEVRVSGVVDGDTVRLNDGRQVRLVGLQAPKLPLGRKNFPTWPLAQQSKSLMEALALGRDFTLHYGGARLDRHGRVLAHMVRDDGLWLQGEMLTRGFARVYTFADNRALAQTMLELEHNARREKHGIWGLRYYQVLPPEKTGERKNSFQLVQGRVLDVANVRGVVYLNFGPDWRTDFTVRVDKKVVKLFTKSGVDLASLNGAEVRVRGWLKSRNGPMIEISHPEPLERVGRPDPTPN